MKVKPAQICIYLIFLISLLLPWFTYNSKVMGYCWGFQFVLLWILPVIVIGMYVFWKRTKIMFLLTEVSLIGLLVCYIISLGRWQEVCNITDGYHWKDGLHTATLGYWLSVILFLSLTVLLQIRRKETD